MGFTRSIYYLFNWEYVGTKEKEEIKKQQRLKTELNRQIINTYRANRFNNLLKRYRLVQSIIFQSHSC